MKNKTIAIEIEQFPDGHIPLIGWHSPEGTGEHEGHKVNVSVAGGIQTLIVQVGDGKRYKVSLTKIAEQIVKKIIAGDLP